MDSYLHSVAHPETDYLGSPARMKRCFKVTHYTHTHHGHTHCRDTLSLTLQIHVLYTTLSYTHMQMHRHIIHVCAYYAYTNTRIGADPIDLHDCDVICVCLIVSSGLDGDRVGDYSVCVCVCCNCPACDSQRK